eukprot:Nitzschia sp. Nitz4//scaffold122_size67431//24937//25602//NITZ4_006083-RA/size67431-processed-gene-0.39-mRNA-1//-1//CDS//3329534397//950//frame0
MSISVQNYSETPHWVVSPSNSDHNYYGSPATSPGGWNVASPVSATGFPGTPPAVIPNGATNTHDFLGLPEDSEKHAKLEKDDLDIRREKIAHARAQKLMARHVGVEQVPTSPMSPASSTSSELDDNGYAIRQAKIREYKEKKRQAKVEGSAATSPRPMTLSPPGCVVKPRKECLATTTRKKKAVTAEEEVETINDYKCPYDLDREKEAKKRALKLLEELGY